MSFTSKHEQKSHLCRHVTPDESSDVNSADYSVLSKANEYIDYEQVENCRSETQDQNTADTLTHFVTNTVLSDMTQVTHLISDNSINDITTVTGLVPNSISGRSVGQLIAQVSGNIVPLNDAVPSTSFNEVIHQNHEISNSVEEILEHPNSPPNTYQNSSILEEAPSLPGSSDVLSQAFAVMGDNIMTECVSLDTCSVLPSSQESVGNESTIYTLVTVDGDDPQPTLINIPSISSAGTEENVTLQINFPDNGCSEVFIIKG